MARRYLRAYGPAKPEDFARWWELRLVPARKLFQSIEDELEEAERLGAFWNTEVGLAYEEVR
jgi:hypothetical protein